MFLEVSIEDEESQVKKFETQELLIGASSECDLCIKEIGISRKHLKIIERSGKFFVVDLNSTNGSIINGNKIPPNKEVEFTSFFPVLIGPKVSISLISDEEASMGEYQDFVSDETSSGTHISRTNVLTTMQASSSNPRVASSPTQNVRSLGVKSISEGYEKKKVGNSGHGMSLLFSALVLGGAYWFYQDFFEKKSLNHFSKVEKNQQEVNDLQAAVKDFNLKAKPSLPQIKKREMLKKRDDVFVKALTSVFDLDNENHGGVYTEGESLYLYIPSYEINFFKSKYSSRFYLMENKDFLTLSWAKHYLIKILTTQNLISQFRLSKKSGFKNIFLSIADENGDIVEEYFTSMEHLESVDSFSIEEEVKKEFNRTKDPLALASYNGIWFRL